MAQILVPVADEATGSWTSTPLWSKVDDDSTVSPSGDGTTITSDDNKSPDTADFQLSSGSDPGVSTGHVLRARWNKDASGGHTVNAEVQLWQGIPDTGSFIATLQELDISDVETLSEVTLSGAQADSITNYGALFLRVNRGGDTGGNPNGRRSLVVDLVELEVPDAGAPTQTIAVGAVSETESAQTVSPVPGAVSATVSAVSESEAAQAVAVTSAVSVTVGVVAEAESAQTVTATPGVVSVAVGTVSEIETAQIVSPAQEGGTQTVAVGVVSETESAQTVAPAPTVTAPVGVVTEAESAGTVTATPGTVPVTVGAVSESETAQAVTTVPGVTSVAVGAVGEVEAAQSVSPVQDSGAQNIVVNVASEVESVQAVSVAPGGVAIAVATVAELETIQPVALVVGAPQNISVEVEPPAAHWSTRAVSPRGFTAEPPTSHWDVKAPEEI